MLKSLENFIFSIGIFTYCCFVYISFFNVYQTDDYMLAYGSIKNGNPIKNVIEIYQHWSGRYFSFLIASSNNLTHNSNQLMAKINPVIYSLAFIFSAVLNFKLYFNLKGFESVKKSLILFFVYLVSLSSLSENVFWYTGSQVYFLPVILSLFLSYFIGKYYKNSNKLYSYLSLLSIILIIGCNEIISIIWLGIAITLVFWKKDNFSKIFLAFTILSITISFAAPGNYQRLDPQEEKSLILPIKYAGIAFLNGIFVLVKVFFVAPLTISVFKKEIEIIKGTFNQKNLKYLFLIPIAGFMFTGMLLLTSERVLDNLIFFSLLISCAYLGYFVKKIPLYLLMITGVILVLPPMYVFPKKSIYFKINHNLQNIFKDTFYNDLVAYNVEMKNRHKFLKNSKTKKIFLKPIVNKPSALYFEEIGSFNKRNYINNQLEKYYKKENVALEK